MNSLKLNEEDLLTMRTFYKEELDKTLARLAHIRSVLETIDGDSLSIQINVNTKSESPVFSAKVDSPAASLPKKKGAKRGPKGIWANLIIKRLRQLDRPVTYEELAQEVMLLASIPNEKKEKTLQSIRPVVFRLRSKEGKIFTVSSGKREKLIVLKNWVDENGKLKSEYAKKITDPKPQIPNVRRGRKAVKS